MRCAACDVLLTERELITKHPTTGDFMDLCTDCYTSYKEALAELVDDSGIVYSYNLSGIET